MCHEDLMKRRIFSLRNLFLMMNLFDERRSAPCSWSCTSITAPRRTPSGTRFGAWTPQPASRTRSSMLRRSTRGSASCSVIAPPLPSATFRVFPSHRPIQARPRTLCSASRRCTTLCMTCASMSSISRAPSSPRYSSLPGAAHFATHGRFGTLRTRRSPWTCSKLRGVIPLFRAA